MQLDEATNAKRPLEQRVRLLFVGDAMCHLPQVRSAYSADGILNFRNSFAGVKSYFDDADIAVANLETTISPNKRYSGYPTFASPAEYAEALQWLGTDAVMLANNHCCDRGAEGIRTTIAKLDSLGMAYTGIGCQGEDAAPNRTLRLERNGIKFAFLNYTYGTNGNPVPKGYSVNLIDTTKMVNDIRLACEWADCVVAYMHWGNEYERQPSRTQRRLAQFLHRNGVGIVVGSHPHVVQPIVASDEQITLYSLGNFVSNQQWRYSDGGILAEIEVVKRSDSLCRYALKTVPVWVKCPGHKIIAPDTTALKTLSASQRECYNRFVDDTEQLLEGGVK